MAHPPIICHRCGLKIADADERPKNGKDICKCNPVGRGVPESLCTSRPQPVNLDSYDRRMR